jgi:hypothetical protein
MERDFLESVFDNSITENPEKYVFSPVVKFIVPDWGDIGDSGIGLTLSPQSGIMNLVTDMVSLWDDCTGPAHSVPPPSSKP